MGFGDTLKALRKQLGKTTTQCAADIGVTQPAWNQWELGVREPKFDKLRDICRLLNCSADELLGLQEEKKSVKIEQRGNGNISQIGNGNISQIGNGNTAADCSNCASKQLADLMKQLGITVADLASIAAKKSAAKLPRKR